MAHQDTQATVAIRELMVLLVIQEHLQTQWEHLRLRLERLLLSLMLLLILVIKYLSWQQMLAPQDLLVSTFHRFQME